MGKMTRVPENVELMVVRSGDCHVPCARPGLPEEQSALRLGGCPRSWSTGCIGTPKLGLSGSSHPFGFLLMWSWFSGKT